MLISTDWITRDTASPARNGPEMGLTASTQPQPVSNLGQGDDSPAVWAGGRHDVRRPCFAERVDQTQHRGNASFGPRPGEQFGPVFDGPGQLPALSPPGGDLSDGDGHRLWRHSGVNCRDHLKNDLDRIGTIVRWTGMTARVALTVSGGNPSGLLADCTRQGCRTACIAVPVLGAPMKGAQRLPALGAARWRDVHRSRLDQANEQRAGHSGSR